MTSSRSRFFISSLLGLVLSALFLTIRLQAATLTVINTNDAGAGSLRQAIADAASGDTITFAVAGTISLTTGELTINKDLTIQGPGANVLNVQRNAVAAFRIFTVNAGRTVNITGLTISNGSATQGGGIINSGTLSLSRCVISGNAATVGGNGGGGIQNLATLNVDQCTISGNSAQFTGGGIAMINGGTALITNSTISGNTTERDGGGLTSQGINTAANVTLINCTVSGNTAATFGGGILNVATGAPTTVNLINCTITGNNAPFGSGIGNFVNSSTATLTLKNSIVANNLGSAQFITGAPAVTTSLGFNLVSDNSLTPAAGDQQNTNPLLGPLANNGGLTQTHALLPGSPAIDKGMNSGQATDQRGFARTVDLPALANAAGGDGTDIGAFEFGAAVAQLNVQAADPAVCLDPGGLVGVTATLTNLNAAGAAASFTAALPPGLTAVAATCVADVNPGGCSIAANGGSVSWNGNLNANQTVTIIYRARIAANVVQGTQLTINSTANVGGATTNVTATLTVNCPAILNARVSDQKAGSVLVFPYYTSTIGGASDTRLTISNISNSTGTTNVHLFFIDGTTCQQADQFLCLTPNASFSFKASDYDPGNTGYLIAVAVDRQGVPIQNNVLIGNAFVNTPTFLDNYSAESFWANSFAVATVDGTSATLYFDQVGYDAVPKQFAVELQSPVDAIGQQIVTAGLSGNLVTSQMTGAAQVGTGLAFNEKEVFTSFASWLTGTCQARGTINTNSPRVPNGLGNLIKTGQAGTLKFNVGAAVGLLLTTRTATWKGIRTLHKTQTTATTIIIPIFAPVC